MTTTIHVRTPTGVRQTSDLGEVRELLEREETFWIDTSSIDAPLHALLTDVLKLHPLAVEDILLDRPGPKVEDYGEYLYVVIHGVVCTGTDVERAGTVELDLVLSQRWLLTHHRGQLRAPAEVAEEFSRNTKVMERGPAFIAHAVIDRMVDLYLPLTEAFDEQVDALETDVVERTSTDIVPRIFRLKRALQRVRRTAAHQREVLQRLSRGEFEQIPERALPFFRDIHDHFVRVVDLAEGNRELLSAALDAYLSQTSNRMNEVMKTLALVSTIMLPLTFIAGVYGMNFDHMPELHWRYGYAFALGLMAVVGSGMALWFRHKKWL
ncbi:MAG: magnesium/cobalt transporter CorA [Deltaproteobacteria bacterium]|nr:magnesium/cobalt transporter CorA [Myxococcales bacterium]MDP3215087.1 magnesium/cobalt transporter CorA [Deltaproteobacteria bacterium]